MRQLLILTVAFLSTSFIHSRQVNYSESLIQSPGTEKPQYLMGDKYNCFKFKKYFIKVEKVPPQDFKDKKIIVRKTKNNKSICDDSSMESDYELIVTGIDKLLGVYNDFMFVTGKGEWINFDVIDLTKRKIIYNIARSHEFIIDKSGILIHEIREPANDKECPDLNRANRNPYEGVTKVRNLHFNLKTGKKTKSKVIRCDIEVNY